MTTPPPTTENPRKSGWTPERRRKQAEAIRRWQPWAKSTGPRTAAGKDRTKYNAWKHGLRGAQHRKMARLLRAQAAFVRFVLASQRVAKLKNPANELLAAPLLSSRPEHRGVEGSGPLNAGFLGYARNDGVEKFELTMVNMVNINEVMQKTCFLRPPDANS